MFAEREVIKQAVEEVLRRSESLGRGDLLLTELIEAAAGIERYTAFWSRLIVRLKREHLRRRSIALWPVHEVGYRLCTKEEQLNMVAVKRQQRALRQFRRAAREVSAVPSNELSAHQRLVQWFRLDQIRGQAKAVADNLRRQEKFRRTETLPPRPRL